MALNLGGEGSCVSIYGHFGDGLCVGVGALSFRDVSRYK